MFSNKIVQMATAPQMQQPAAPQSFGDVMMGMMGNQGAPQGMQFGQTGSPAPPKPVSQAQYDAIMKKVRAGQERSPRETQTLQQYMMENQAGGSSRNQGPAPGNDMRAIFNPFGLLADAISPRR